MILFFDDAVAARHLHWSDVVVASITNAELVIGNAETRRGAGAIVASRSRVEIQVNAALDGAENGERENEHDAHIRSTTSSVTRFEYGRLRSVVTVVP